MCNTFDIHGCIIEFSIDHRKGKLFYAENFSCVVNNNHENTIFFSIFLHCCFVVLFNGFMSVIILHRCILTLTLWHFVTCYNSKKKLHRKSCNMNWKLATVFPLKTNSNCNLSKKETFSTHIANNKSITVPSRKSHLSHRQSSSKIKNSRQQRSEIFYCFYVEYLYIFLLFVVVWQFENFSIKIQNLST